MQTNDQLTSLPLPPSFAECSRFLKETVTDNPYIPHTPTPKQARFLALPNLEALFGGAVGGGKSDALLMAALQFVQTPGYSALLLRKSYADLTKPESLIPRSFEWLGGTDARWSGQNHQWSFPRGATLSFGYLDIPNDKYQFQSAAYGFVGWDELTQFREPEYRYLFSRLRQPEGQNVPLRVRAGTNPGGAGHQWVRQRFLVEGPQNGRIFIPSKLADNPYLNRDSYLQSLRELDPVTRKQLEDGDWAVRPSGGIFKREWFGVPVAASPVCQTKVRSWDLAATVPKPGEDPDWTCGPKITLHRGIWYIEDMNRFQGTPKDVQDRIRQVAALDGRNLKIVMETEPGASGVSLIDHYRRNVLVGYYFQGARPIRGRSSEGNWIGPLSSAAQAGNVRLVNGGWISDFLDECEAYGTDPKAHDDQLIAVAQGMAELADGGGTGEHSMVDDYPERDPEQEVDDISRGRTVYV